MALFLWVTGRRREVGIGYGWTVRGTNVALLAGAVLVGLRYDSVPVRDAAALGALLSTLGVTVVSWQRRRAGVAKQRGAHPGPVGPGERHDRHRQGGAGLRRVGAQFPPNLDLIPVAFGVLALVAGGVATGGMRPCCRWPGGWPAWRSSVRCPTECCWVTGTWCSRGCRVPPCWSWCGGWATRGRWRWRCSWYRPACSRCSRVPSMMAMAACWVVLGGERGHHDRLGVRHPGGPEGTSICGGHGGHRVALPGLTAFGTHLVHGRCCPARSRCGSPTTAGRRIRAAKWSHCVRLLFPSGWS